MSEEDAVDDGSDGGLFVGVEVADGFEESARFDGDREMCAPPALLFTSLEGHSEGAGANIQSRFVEFEDMTYLKVDAWGPDSVFTTVPIVSHTDFYFIEKNWATLASNIRDKIGG